MFNSKEVFMARRHSINRRSSRRSFSRGAMRVHPKNVVTGVGIMRGGIRL